MVVQAIGKGFTKVFGSRNERVVKSYNKRVVQINALEEQTRRLTDAELRAKTAEFRKRSTDGESKDTLLLEVMAVARETMDRAVGIRSVFRDEHGFDPQQLSPEMAKLFEKLKAEADAKEPDPVLGGEPAPGYLQIDVPNAFYEAIRELYPESKPPFRARPFDVQLIGGMVLGEGKIAEMRTGEGKTIVAPLACYVACCDALKCHVVTVNDYLVQRDRDWVFPFYYFLGLTVGAIHPHHQQPPHLKAQAYQCDVLYGTNSELGFDYLRDNMKLSTQEQVQKTRDFCIIDEVDSILIDEARTPLIISGPANNDAPRYDLADQIAKHLMTKQKPWAAANQKVEDAEVRIKGLEGDARNARDKTKANEYRDAMKRLMAELPALEAARDQHVQYYEVEMEKKAAHLTHDGTAEAQKIAGVGSFYVGNNMDLPHLINNAIRAHAVYLRDRDYVVQDGEVVIVDVNTGRLMVGRQWSDGLHQAAEAKEGVKIKQETQTLATVTIQNFFKLYKRLAGMTGTAITEATEFNEVYKLDVVSVPTNKPIQRIDRDDLIFMGEKDKWSAIVDEIERVHNTGRPVLVGTTSVERSEMLSAMLGRKHGIKHEVLNAKAENAEREGNIVEDAGHLGAVMIATNMAGRGTDIKLQPLTREQLIDHWKTRNLLPRQAEASMTDDQVIALSYRHQAANELRMPKKEAEAAGDDELKLKLLRHWCEKDAYIDEKKASAMSMEECLDALDRLPDYKRHRLELWPHIEAMGGLHIVGTERHESRRIDNQLRGRAGRQGDQGSSRFFLSLEDDLMKMFAGGKTKILLSKLGMKEGDAIEHSMVSKSVGRAQRKVEERNYEIRKNLLEYDEVMEYQRTEFYAIRQDVLEGKDVGDLIFDYIAESVNDAVGTYLASDYVKQQAAEWCQSTLDVSVDPARLHLHDLRELQEIVRKSARYEVSQIIDVTLGEYMSNDIPAEDWDLKGLSQWAMSRFDVNLPVSRLRGMNPTDVAAELTASAQEQIDKKDLDGLAAFLDPDIPQRELSEWAKQKFGLELGIEELRDYDIDSASSMILEKARQTYRQREITYPVEFAMEVIMQGAKQDQNWAVDQLKGLMKSRYLVDLEDEAITTMNGQEIFQRLLDEQKAWLAEDGKLKKEATDIVAKFRSDPGGLGEKLAERYGVALEDGELDGVEGEQLEALVYDKGRTMFTGELQRLERFVLLQILDKTWKEHLYSMDQVKDAVGLRGYAEKDPRIEYKREGAAQFVAMQRSVRDQVTDLIFRARLTPNVQLNNAYGDQQQAQHPDAQGAASGGGAPSPEMAAAAAAAVRGGTAEQRQDLAAADRAGVRPDRNANMTRKQRRAAEARERHENTSGSKKQRKRRKR
ncbi:MAG: preprotein translocase subunit SecA [Planctomycetota bacterium]